MKLMLDGGGGLAGDMLCAALLALGADADRVLTAMETVGGRLGQASVALSVDKEGVHRLRILLEANDRHLAASQARRILDEEMTRQAMPQAYRDGGMRALNNLVEAEGEAHRQMPEMDRHIHEYAHHHGHVHEQGHHHHHPHHSHETGADETFLHEAQDIVMDICGVMTALWSMETDPRIELLTPISVGGGLVRFSHGELPVPAPATRIILEKNKIPWLGGPIDAELCTPTGVALLAALGGKMSEMERNQEALKSGLSRGTRNYAIPPLRLYAY